MLNMRLPDEIAKELEQFDRYYDLQLRIGGSRAAQHLGDLQNPYCRFCNKTRPKVGFKSKAHVIPELFGRNNNTSSYECNTCNTNYFSGFEKYLANWIGNPVRALLGVKGKRGVPAHRQQDDAICLIPNSRSMEIRLPNNEPCEFIDFDKNVAKFHFIKSPYIPLHAYKAMAKVGFLMLQDSELPLFEITREWLMQSITNQAFKNWEMLVAQTVYETNYAFKPEALLFTRKDDAPSPSPDKILIIRSNLTQYQLCLPFAQRDLSLLETTPELAMPRLPLLLPDSLYDSYSTLQSTWTDMSSEELVKDEKHSLSLRSTSPIIYTKNNAIPNNDGEPSNNSNI